MAIHSPPYIAPTPPSNPVPRVIYHIIWTRTESLLNAQYVTCFKSQWDDNIWKSMNSTQIHFGIIIKRKQNEPVPKGITGTFFSLQSFIIWDTCSVVVGVATASGAWVGWYDSSVPEIALFYLFTPRPTYICVWTDYIAMMQSHHAVF